MKCGKVLIKGAIQEYPARSDRVHTRLKALKKKAHLCQAERKSASPSLPSVPDSESAAASDSRFFLTSCVGAQEDL